MIDGAKGHSRTYRPDTNAREKKQLVEAEQAGAPFIYFRQWEEGSGATGDLVICTLSGSSRFTLGRGPANDITPADPAVSLVHAELREVGGEWVVEDDGLSTNGTFVRDFPTGDFERVGGRRRLHDNCEIRAGDTELRFVIPSTGGSLAKTRSPAGSLASGQRITPAQHRVLVKLCEPVFTGRSSVPATNPEIANSSLHLAEDTVKSHMQELYKAFDLKGEPSSSKRAKLVEKAIESGAVSKADYGST